MSWLLMEKLLRHQQSVRSSEGCCVDRLNSPRPNSIAVNSNKVDIVSEIAFYKSFDGSEPV